MAEKQNITQVVKQNLCNSCGACFVVCKAGAIEYKETVGGYYFPNVDNEACTNCGLCLSVCPGVNFGQGLMESMPADPFAGVSLNAFVGKATDKKIYENSQSGGIVSALLVQALNSGFANSVVTVGMDWGNPPRPKAFLAKSVDEIIFAQKSKYCPVPAISAIKEIIGSNRRIIFVGTSCQVHGLLNIMDKMPKVKDNISLIIGLVCDRVMTYAALDFLICRAGLLNQNKKLLEFRDKLCGGYPGNVHIHSSNGKNIIMPAKERMRIKDLFTPARCRICFDKMNVFSDIVISDPHGIKNVDRDMGESIAILRTTRGQQFFHQALEGNAYSAREISYHDILAGQQIDAKRKEWQGYVHAWKKLGHQLPNYCQRVLQGAENNERVPYLDKLKYSLSLDEHSSRAELLRYTERQLLMRKVRGILLWPVRVLKRFFYAAYKKIIRS